MERWSEKIAVVTGASSGIGASVVEHLVGKGMMVFGFARRLSCLDDVADRVKNMDGLFYGKRVNMTETEDIKNAFNEIEQQVGPVQVLVNCAGTFAETSLCDGNVQKWRNTFEVNVIGLCTATREAVAHMKGHSLDGHIIHMNCYSGHTPLDLVGENVYPASKYAVTALTNSWRYELQELGTKIKVTSISPSFVKNTKIAKASGIRPSVVNTLTPKDVSEAVLYVLGTPPHVQVHELILRTVGCNDVKS
nr:Farnesol dehydrogenase 1 [Harmonia axyridis]